MDPEKRASEKAHRTEDTACSAVFLDDIDPIYTLAYQVLLLVLLFPPRHDVEGTGVGTVVYWE